MTERLKPCPFCGWSELKVSIEDWDMCDDVYVIRCPYCGVVMDRDCEWELIDAWNTRAIGKIPFRG